MRIGRRRTALLWVGLLVLVALVNVDRERAFPVWLTFAVGIAAIIIGQRLTGPLRCP